MYKFPTLKEMELVFMNTELDVSIGDSIVIQPLEELQNLGYAKDDPDIFQHANKVYQVSGIVRVDRDLRYFIVKGTNQMFIDADVQRVEKLVYA